MTDNPEWNVKACESFTVRIHMAGNYDQAEQVCREYCRRGFCVSVSRTNYIYTGGEESGFTVTIINYPRFPVENFIDLKDHAFLLANALADRLCQQSFTIENPTEMLFFSCRPEDKQR